MVGAKFHCQGCYDKKETENLKITQKKIFQFNDIYLILSQWNLFISIIQIIFIYELVITDESIKKVSMLINFQFLSLNKCYC